VIPIALPGDEQDSDSRLRGHGAACGEDKRRDTQRGSALQGVPTQTARIPDHVIELLQYAESDAAESRDRFVQRL
jgi:hypothetical protein